MERKESLTEGSLIKPDLIRIFCEIGGMGERPMHQEYHTTNSRDPPNLPDRHDYPQVA